VPGVNAPTPCYYLKSIFYYQETVLLDSESRFARASRLDRRSFFWHRMLPSTAFELFSQTVSRIQLNARQSHNPTFILYIATHPLPNPQTQTTQATTSPTLPPSLPSTSLIASTSSTFSSASPSTIPPTTPSPPPFSPSPQPPQSKVFNTPKPADYSLQSYLSQAPTTPSTRPPPLLTAHPSTAPCPDSVSSPAPCRGHLSPLVVQAGADR
jgi:hypothetical protein